MEDARQEEEKKQQGISIPNIGIGRGFPGLGKSGSKLAVRLAVQAGAAVGRGIGLLFTTPTGWVILTIAAVAIITFMVVLGVVGKDV